MFLIAGNDKIQVLVQTRCGHTNMFQYLGLSSEDFKEHDTLDNWVASPRRVVVLRHPVERMNSAVQLYDTQIKFLIDLYHSQTDKPKFIESLYQKNPTYTDYFVKNFFNIDDRDEVREKINFLVHSFPYMHHIVDYDFEIVKFENLKDYIPPRGDPIYNKDLDSGVTNQTNKVYAVFPENRHYTEDDLLREVQLYESFIETKKELSVTDWRLLTTR